MPSLVSARRRWGGLFLKLAAVVAAGLSQAVVESRPGLSVAGFALGAVLFVIAERAGGSPIAPEREPALTSTPRTFWWLFGTGCAFCFATAPLVELQASPATTHPLWVVGMTLLIVAAVRARGSEPRQPRPTLKILGTLLLLFVVAGVLYGWHLSTIPPEIHGDEAEVGNDAVELLARSPFNLFTVGWYWLPMFHALPAAASIKLFGVNLLGLRSSSVAMGVATVLLLFAVVNRWWGYEVALLSALVLASTRFFIHLSRTGYHYIGTPFVSVLVVWLFSRVWRDVSLSAAVWCGIALGLGMQGYYASRLVPVLLAMTGVLWLVGSARDLRAARVDRCAVIVVAAMATAAPLIGYFWNHWDELWARTRGTSVFNSGAIEHLSYSYETHDLMTILLIQAQKAFTLFNRTGDTSLQYGYVAGGLFEPVSAVLFVLGVAALCARPLQRRNVLLLLWTGVPLVVGVALTIDTPFFPRISGLVPFAAVIVALALHSLSESVRAVLPRAVGRIAAAAVVAGVLAAVFANSLRSYFVEYAPHHRHGPAVEIAEWTLANGDGKVTYMVGGAPNFYIKHGTIRFLTHGYDTRDIANLDDFLATERFDPATSRFIIMPPGYELLPKLVGAVGPLDVHEHRNIGGDIDFYTAIPWAALRGGNASRGHNPPL